MSLLPFGLLKMKLMKVSLTFYTRTGGFIPELFAENVNGFYDVFRNSYLKDIVILSVLLKSNLNFMNNLLCVVF